MALAERRLNGRSAQPGAFDELVTGAVADIFRQAGFRSIRHAHETPFNIVLEVRR